MRSLLAILPLALAANAAAATPAQSPILPGYWKWSAKVFLGLVPVEDGRECLDAEEIADFLAYPGNRHYRCTYPVKQIGDGKVTMQGACVDKKGRQAPIRAEGTYSPERFKLNVKLTTINGLRLSGVMNATRVSAQCPVPAQAGG